jgi:hypothetical protein
MGAIRGVKPKHGLHMSLYYLNCHAPGYSVSLFQGAFGVADPINEGLLFFER